jgi:hypothetical protein
MPGIEDSLLHYSPPLNVTVGPNLILSTLNGCSPFFARSAQANNALTVDLSPLTIPSNERILFKKPLLKSPLLAHYYIYLGERVRPILEYSYYPPPPPK